MFNVWCAFVALGMALLLGQAGFGQTPSGGLQRSAAAQVSASLTGALRAN